MQNFSRKWIWLVVILCLVGLVTIWFSEIRTFVSSQSVERRASSVELSNGMTVVVEIADTQQERVQGLSGHAPLADSQGMLFLFETKEIQGFWMKDMLFPIDIIWIDGDTVVGFQQDAQPETPAKTIFYSPEPVDRVLEVSAGFVARNEVRVGDVLDVELVDK
ncbi:DUF192 domain-containing protein [Candidatus Uhrbacteria bacterium]|nr:DUF192 domain-containing protein [Candidatus Uhrbacteria bacterium]